MKKIYNQANFLKNYEPLSFANTSLIKQISKYSTGKKEYSNSSDFANSDWNITVDLKYQVVRNGDKTSYVHNVKSVPIIRKRNVKV